MNSRRLVGNTFRTYPVIAKYAEAKGYLCGALIYRQDRVYDAACVNTKPRSRVSAIRCEQTGVRMGRATNTLREVSSDVHVSFSIKTMLLRCTTPHHRKRLKTKSLIFKMLYTNAALFLALASTTLSAAVVPRQNVAISYSQNVSVVDTKWDG